MSVLSSSPAELNDIGNWLLEAYGAARARRGPSDGTALDAIEADMLAAMLDMFNTDPEWFNSAWTQKAYAAMINSNVIELPAPV